MFDDPIVLAFRVLQIVWFDLLLSGDNAIVIALACRSLPPEQRRMGILLGAAAAVALRVAFTVGIVSLLALPWLKLGGGILLLGIAVNFVVHGQDGDDAEVPAAATLWRAIWTIVVADAVMSLDNVLAIAAAAHGSFVLILFGLGLSIPLIVFGSTLVMRLMAIWPWLSWIGAAMLGWVSGEMVASDPAAAAFLTGVPEPGYVVGGAAAVLVVLAGLVLQRRSKNATGA